MYINTATTYSASAKFYSTNIADTAWRKGLRIWNLSYRTHSDILQSLSDDVPVFDEICKRCLGFIDTCLGHSNDIVRFFAWHGIMWAPGTSLIGRNLKMCSDRYGFRVCDCNRCNR